jgi:hypothetical protein
VILSNSLKNKSALKIISENRITAKYFNACFSIFFPVHGIYTFQISRDGLNFEICVFERMID